MDSQNYQAEYQLKQQIKFTEKQLKEFSKNYKQLQDIMNHNVFSSIILIQAQIDLEYQYFLSKIIPFLSSWNIRILSLNDIQNINIIDCLYKIKFERLIELNLQCCKIRSIQIFSNQIWAPNLEILDLSGNEIISYLPLRKLNFTSMKKVELDFCDDLQNYKCSQADWPLLGGFQCEGHIMIKQLAKFNSKILQIEQYVFQSIDHLQKLPKQVILRKLRK